MKRIIIAFAAVAALSACATHPDRIQPAAYAADCPPNAAQRLAELTAEQKRAANTDAIGVLMIGLPLGSMSGPDHKDEIAKLKACVA